MKRLYLILPILAALLLTSCITQQRCLERYPPQVTTETITETVTVYRDTTIYVHLPAVVVTDTVTVYIRDGLAQTEPSNLYAPFAESYAQVVNGRLKHTLTQRDTLINRVIARAIKEAKQTVYVTKTETVEVITNKLSHWQWLQVWVGRVLFFILLIITGFKLLTKGLI